ncbi:hypothetical protein RQP46_008431 [Phenoliferia psychrophenolica]
MATSNRARGKKVEEDSDVDMDGGEHENDDGEEGEEEDEAADADATQDEAISKKRSTRAGFRELLTDVDAARSNLLETTVPDLSSLVERGNELYKGVTAPAEAILDSRVLMAASDAGALKARQLKLDANAFDTDEFLLKLVQFMGGRVGAKKAHIRADSEDGGPGGDDGELNARWTKVGRVLAKESRRVPALDHMYGPLAIQVKEKKAKQARQNYKVDEKHRVQGESLQADDIHKDPLETTKMVAELAKILEERAGDAGMPYLEFIVNPESFAQTVENMFYFSFLVKEGKAAIELDETEDSPNFGDSICFTCLPAEGDAAAGKKHQLIFELTHQVWRDAIKAYDIQEPVIPMREGHEAKTGAKWN